MATGHRAFVNKLNKRGAAEVRKQVSSTYLGDITKSSSAAGIFACQNIPLCDVVEPPDFEEFIVQNHSIVEHDPLHQLFEFPDDSIAVELVRRRVRTIAPIIPERGYEVDRHVRDCIRCYTKDYQTVVRSYQKFSFQHSDNEERTRHLQNVMPQEYELQQSDAYTDSSGQKGASIVTTNEHLSTSCADGVPDLKSSQSDPLIPTLLEPTSDAVVDAINYKERQKNRLSSIFSVYPHQTEEEVIEQRQPAMPPMKHFGHRLLVKCLQLKLELDIEPIFASMALYNVRERKKVSENFYFDMTPEPLKKMVEAYLPYQDVSSLSRSCIFEITHPSPDLFLVIKLEKVLQQGDISEVAESYMKDDKNRERARSNAQYYCERLGRYRMPFAWTAVYLMNVIYSANSLDSEKEQQSRMDSLERGRVLGVVSSENFQKSFADRPKSITPEKQETWSIDDISSSMASFRPVTLTVSSFFKQEGDKLSDEDLFKFLVELKKPAFALKKLKCLPVTLKLDVSPCPAEVKNCLTPELYRIDPYLDDNIRPTKEVVEFPVTEIFEPYMTYRNLLYVSPKSLNFANRQGSARNLAVKVCFMEGEEEIHAMPVW